MIRVGIIGLGMMGRTHYEAYQQIEGATAALKTGKHVLCEKPLARTSAEGEKIAAAARSAKGFFMPAMCMRFWPQWAWLKQTIEKETYGKVLSATFRRVSSMPPGWYKDGKISGGAALDLHIHDTDFIQHLFGMPAAVYSRGYTKTSDELDHLTTYYIYENIPHVVAEGGWTLAPGAGFTMRYTVNFEHATADYDLAREKEKKELLLIKG